LQKRNALLSILNLSLKMFYNFISRAHVLQTETVWFKDDGGLTKTICETGTTNKRYLPFSHGVLRFGPYSW
jgi:hypothetical protein